MAIADSVQIHPTAVVDAPATIGEHTKIWHFCHVMSGARIGENCTLGQNVFVASQVIIGNGCRVQNNVSLYDGVELGDDVFLGPSCVFTNVVNPRAAVSRRSEIRPILLCCGATVGANATILAGTNIGRWAFIGAGSVVLRDVPDYAVMVGNPARQRGWMSQHGQRLVFDPNSGLATCSASEQTYRLRQGAVELLDAP
jgi:UDP-2-acetamido-3-amino-2,3-dideoxy-glucuronate N-acetyltransferase